MDKGPVQARTQTFTAFTRLRSRRICSQIYSRRFAFSSCSSSPRAPSHPQRRPLPPLTSSGPCWAWNDPCRAPAPSRRRPRVPTSPRPQTCCLRPPPFRLLSLLLGSPRPESLCEGQGTLTRKARRMLSRTPPEALRGRSATWRRERPCRGPGYRARRARRGPAPPRPPPCPAVRRAAHAVSGLVRFSPPATSGPPPGSSVRPDPHRLRPPATAQGSRDGRSPPWAGIQEPSRPPRPPGPGSPARAAAARLTGQPSWAARRVSGAQLTCRSEGLAASRTCSQVSAGLPGPRALASQRNFYLNAGP